MGGWNLVHTQLEKVWYGTDVHLLKWYSVIVNKFLEKLLQNNQFYHGYNNILNKQKKDYLI